MIHEYAKRWCRRPKWLAVGAYLRKYAMITATISHDFNLLVSLRVFCIFIIFIYRLFYIINETIMILWFIRNTVSFGGVEYYNSAVCRMSSQPSHLITICYYFSAKIRIDFVCGAPAADISHHLPLKRCAGVECSLQKPHLPNEWMQNLPTESKN